MQLSQKDPRKLRRRAHITGLLCGIHAAAEEVSRGLASREFVELVGTLKRQTVFFPKLECFFDIDWLLLTWRVDLRLYLFAVIICKHQQATSACFKFQVSWRWSDLPLFTRNVFSHLPWKYKNIMSFFEIGKSDSQQTGTSTHAFLEWLDGRKMFTCNLEGSNLRFCRAHLLHQAHATLGKVWSQQRNTLFCS